MLTQCGMQQKINHIRQTSAAADIAIPQETTPPEISTDKILKDTTEMTESHEGPIIMNAVRDENGEMTATDEIVAAKVVARFRNVAERHGKVDLKFQVIVPEILQDSKWQLQLDPDLFVLEDSLRLEPVIITGSEYRKRQLRGYEQYRRFLASIITDPDKMVNEGQLELFIKRNIPALYKFRNDSSFVSDEDFQSAYGVTEKDAIEHYTRKFLVWRNNNRIAKKGKMYDKYIKAPIVSEGIRLDTVIVAPNGDFIYDYVQTIHTSPRLRKADIVLSGKILEEGQSVYRIPESKPITFYISSLSTLVDKSERYLTQVIARKVEANTACYVDFFSGRSDIVQELGNNKSEIARIKKNLAALASDNEFDMDSIVVTAFSSPEGSVKFNSTLSEKRAASISSYFKHYLKECRDSLKMAEGAILHFDGVKEVEEGNGVDGAKSILGKKPVEVEFISRSAGENWTMLDAIVASDKGIDEGDKVAYQALSSEKDPDRRELRMRELASYKYMREKIYPRLRTVKFDFHLHRKGMVHDTIRLTILDTTYMAGLQAISDRDYKKAISILRPYKDYNLAVAYCAMDYNASAMEILESIPQNDKVHYLLALILSRTGEEKRAAEHYLTACSMNPSFVHRGNLDPEISALVRKFGLDKQE